MPVKVKRNAYGRQLGSFYTEEEMKGIGKVPMTFIRAPYVEAVKCGTEIMAVVNEKIVAVKYNNMLAMSFHPELNESDKIHKYFVDMIINNK